MDRAREQFQKWIFEGECPCCFPDWEFPEIDTTDVWNWIEEFNAWEVHEDIMREWGEEDW